MVQPKVDLGTGAPVPVDAVTVTVRINGRDRSATVTQHTFEKNEVGYELCGAEPGHRVWIDESEVGRGVLEVAGVELYAEPKIEQALDCLADAYSSYCAENPDPETIPEGWVEVAQKLLGPERANNLYGEATRWPSPNPKLREEVDYLLSAIEKAAALLSNVGGPNRKDSAENLHAALCGLANALASNSAGEPRPRDAVPSGGTTALGSRLALPRVGYLEAIEQDDSDDLQKWRAFVFAWSLGRRRCSDMREELDAVLRSCDATRVEAEQLRRRWEDGAG